MTRIRVLHRKVELIDLPLLLGEGRGEVEKIESSAEALRVSHRPLFFPSEQLTLQQHRAGNHAGRNAKNGKPMSLRAKRSNLPL